MAKKSSTPGAKKSEKRASYRVGAALPTADPEIPDSMMCLKDARFNKGGLSSGSIRTTGNPKDTP